MGSAMSANLLRAGHRVIGFDVAADRLRELARRGGEPAESARDVAKRAGVVITSLPSSPALLETARALAAAARRSQVVVETSTLPLAVKLEARRILRGRGPILLDCPLSGTGAQARVRDLVVYVSGDRKPSARIARVLDGFSRAHYYVGPFGAGSRMKFVANLLVAIHNVAAAEALVLGMKAGLDPRLVCDVMSESAGSSRMLQVRGPMMVKGDYSDATMKLDVWRKDMTIIADFARALSCRTPLFTATEPIYEAARRENGREDTAAVCRVLERLSGASRASRAGRARGRSR
jgi:3-hydroxyisobutyrate dehydrogenase-like beta-hydroxyacid dehydrogenase